jgi:hypothetical protein
MGRVGVGPSIRQRLLQVIDLPVQMSVDLTYHGAIPMSHQFGDGQVVVALHEFPGCEAVPSIVHGLLPACREGKAVHSVAHRVLRPRPPPDVAEQLALGSHCHQAGHDLQRRAVQVDDTRVTLALRLVLRDDDSLVIQLNVPGFDVPGLLRPAARMPEEQEEVAEGVALAQAGQKR